MADLWPEVHAARAARSRPAEVRAVYPHRWSVGRDTWQSLFDSAEHEIGILAYSSLFLAEDAGILRILTGKASAGVAVRIALGDPGSPQVAERGAEEGIGDAMAAKIRNALTLYRPLRDGHGIHLRLHRTVLYNSIYRADGEMLVNQHVYGMPAASAPVFHLHKSQGANMFTAYLDSFDRVWEGAAPLS